MTTVYEGTRLDDWLADRLSGDATLQGLGTPPLGTQTVGGAPMRLYDTEPPQTQTGAVVVYPILVYQQQALTPDDCLDFERPGVAAVYLVKVIGAPGASWGGMEPILDRVDALLQGARLAVGAFLFTVLGAEANVKYVDPPQVGGGRARHMGRLWHIVAEPVA